MAARTSRTSLEQANSDAAEVMQAHWFRFADRALYSPFFLRGTGAPRAAARAAEAERPRGARLPVRARPRAARLGALAAAVAAADRTGSVESVEAYRQRIARIVALYTVGLGTVDALRRMTEAQLPVDLDAPPAERDQPFDIEELAPLDTVQLPVTMPGASHRPRRPADALAAVERRPHARVADGHAAGGGGRGRWSRPTARLRRRPLQRRR